MDNKTCREIIKECARTREYAPDYREDGTKMSLTERAALAPTMPLRSDSPSVLARANRYRRAECAHVADLDAMKDSCYDLT